MGMFDNKTKEYEVRITVQTEPGRVSTFKTNVHAQNPFELKKVIKAQHPNLKQFYTLKEIKGPSEKKKSKSSDQVEKAEPSERKPFLKMPSLKFILIFSAIVGPIFLFLLGPGKTRLLIAADSYTSSQVTTMVNPAKLNTKDSNQYWVQGNLISKKTRKEVRFDIKTNSYQIAGRHKSLTEKGKQYEVFEIPSYYHVNSEKIAGDRFISAAKTISRDDSDALNKFRDAYVKDFARQKGLNIADYEIDYDN